MKRIAKNLVRTLLLTALLDPSSRCAAELLSNNEAVPQDVEGQALESHRPPFPPPASLAPQPQLRVLNLNQNVTPKPYSGTPIDVLTYHYDNLRTGWNQNETDLSPTTVKSPNFTMLRSLDVDGNVFAQPLIVSNFTMPDGKPHNILVIATGHNSVYAFDTDNYEELWPHVSLGTPQSSEHIRRLNNNCGDVRPEYGISSTPVIVRDAVNQAAIYVVAATEPSCAEFHTQLHKLDLATGVDLIPPVELSPPRATLAPGVSLSLHPENQWSRSGLAYNAGSIYVSIGSHCDSNPRDTSGWILRYDKDLKLKATFHTIGSAEAVGLASIWMTGFAPAVDSNGDVFVVTGNGDVSSDKKNYGQSVLRLDGTRLLVEDSFTPENYRALNENDRDFGSGGVVLLPRQSNAPGPSMAVVIGKDPVIYLLNRANLGGLSPNNAGALRTLRLSDDPLVRALWGGPAYYGGATSPTFFLQTEHDVLRSYSISNALAPVLSLLGTGTTEAGYGGSIPVVSSSGTTSNTGVVWLQRRSKPISLEAYDAATLGAPIFSADVGDWSNPDYGNSFLTPITANGRVYASAYMKVAVFGLSN